MNGGNPRGALEGMLIYRMQKKEALQCEQILRSLPKWFGIEDGIVEYARAIREMETYVAADSSGLVGFITLTPRSRSTAEIYVMAVKAERHRLGIGMRLIEHAESLLRERGVTFFEVKTLGPSRPNAEYELTRRFYEKAGFLPLEENDLWGEANPCLIMVKCLR
jgi:GNAT superfamily N-acetyltransferase